MLATYHDLADALLHFFEVIVVVVYEFIVAVPVSGDWALRRVTELANGLLQGDGLRIRI